MRRRRACGFSVAFRRDGTCMRRFAMGAFLDRRRCRAGATSGRSCKDADSDRSRCGGCVRGGAGICCGRFPRMWRVLSTVAYGDSKFFENSVAASFVKAAETGGFPFGSAFDIDDKLAALGFRPERYSSVTAGGNVAVHPTWASLDLSQFGCDGMVFSLPAVEGFAESLMSISGRVRPVMMGRMI